MSFNAEERGILEEAIQHLQVALEEESLEALRSAGELLAPFILPGLSRQLENLKGERALLEIRGRHLVNTLELVMKQPRNPNHLCQAQKLIEWHNEGVKV